MKFLFESVLTSLLMLLLFVGTLSAQFSPSQIPDNELFKGYVKEISGETMDYE